jgi:nucleotide-binding universal stress UspA family protein
MVKLLVPIDGSEAALRALRHAIAHGDEIVVVNVQPRADSPALLLHMTQHEIDKAQLEHGEASLDGARQILEASSHAVDARVLLGEPAKVIADLASAEAFDAIVMGTRGMGALGNLALGSTATKVIHLAAVPVTLIR